MSREKGAGTKVLGVRLPLTVYQRLERAALARSIDPGTYVRRWIERAFGESVNTTVYTRRDPRV